MVTFCNVTNFHRHVIARCNSDLDVGQPDDPVSGHSDVDRAVKGTASSVDVGVVETDFPFQGCDTQSAVSEQAIGNVPRGKVGTVSDSRCSLATVRHELSFLKSSSTSCKTVAR